MNAESIKISIYKMEIDKLKDISEREFKDMCEIVAIN